MYNSKANYNYDEFRIPHAKSHNRGGNQQQGPYQIQNPNGNEGGPARGKQFQNGGNGRGKGGYWCRGGGGRGRGRGAGANRLIDLKSCVLDNSQVKPLSVKQKLEEKHDFYCCSCERGFKTQEQVDQHNQEHIVCGLDGCKFEAHSLVVTKHIRMQHEGNLYQRMKNLQTPEDIERWRQERKKNFPSAANVLQKEHELKEKIERREICGIGHSRRRGTPSARPTTAPSTFRYRIQTNDARSRSFAEYAWKLRKLEYQQSDGWTKRMFAPDKKVRDVRVPFFSMNTSKVVLLENLYMKVKMGQNDRLKKQTKVKWKSIGAKLLDRLSDSESEGEDAHVPISDDEEGESESKAEVQQREISKETTLQQPEYVLKEEMDVPNKPAGSLMLINYSSESESEHEDDVVELNNADKMKTSHTPACSNVKGTLIKNPIVWSMTGNDAHNSNKSALSIGSATQNTNESSQMLPNGKSNSGSYKMVIDEFTKDRTFKDKPIFNKPHFVQRKKWFRTKLLETLLQDQIQKERNILLQTCRFVRENNFFDQN